MCPLSTMWPVALSNILHISLWLDPFFIVGKLIDGQAVLVEGDEFDKVQPLIENEIEEREFNQ